MMKEQQKIERMIKESKSKIETNVLKTYLKSIKGEKWKAKK